MSAPGLRTCAPARSQVHSAYDIAYALAIPLYVLLGYSGFYAFGVFNSG